MKNDETAKNQHIALLRATNTPNPSKEDKKALAEHFDEFPHAWRTIADFPGRIQGKIIEDSAADSFLVQEAYRRRLADMRDGLGWQTASEMERILIEQICLNWLRLNYMEAVHREKMKQTHSIKDGIYFEKILDNAQKRFSRACESLAKVKKFLTEADYREEQALQLRAKGAAQANKALQGSENKNLSKPKDLFGDLANLANEIFQTEQPAQLEKQVKSD